MFKDFQISKILIWGLIWFTDSILVACNNVTVSWSFVFVNILSNLFWIFWISMINHLLDPNHWSWPLQTIGLQTPYLIFDVNSPSTIFIRELVVYVYYWAGIQMVFESLNSKKSSVKRHNNTTWSINVTPLPFSPVQFQYNYYISPKSRARPRDTQQGCTKCGGTSPCQWSGHRKKFRMKADKKQKKIMCFEGVVIFPILLFAAWRREPNHFKLHLREL